jgi:DNA invertase Pin-like site-specific DNA recombinase
MGHQSDAIAAYATSRGIEIVRTYADHGRSGLTLAGRNGLRELLDDVSHGRHDFSELLVYDVSRWGRFQDADESAYHEYLCRRAGVMVHYCAEQFENDGSMSSALLKTIKRSMAGEYSRELSVKMFAGQCRLFQMGYRQGGWAGFGFRRQLLDREGKTKGILGNGEQKSIQSDRVILIPGPDEELSIIKEIFTLFTSEFMYETRIARLLNERGIKTDRGLEWSRGGIHGILTDSKFIGTTIYNRKSFKLSKTLVENPATMWMHREDAHGAIVPLAQFAKAQEIIRAREFRTTDENLLASLRGLWAKHGKLSVRLIRADESMPSVALYSKRFQSLTRAYGLIGYKASRRYRYSSVKDAIRKRHRDLCAMVKASLRSLDATVEDQDESDTLLINGQFTISIVLCYCNETPSGNRWLVRLNGPSTPDITLAARLGTGNAEILDYFLLPSSDRSVKKIWLTAENQCRLEVFRFENLDFFLSLAKRHPLVHTP